MVASGVDARDPDCFSERDKFDFDLRLVVCNHDLLRLNFLEQRFHAFGTLRRSRLRADGK